MKQIMRNLYCTDCGELMVEQTDSYWEPVIKYSPETGEPITRVFFLGCPHYDSKRPYSHDIKQRSESLPKENEA